MALTGDEVPGGNGNFDSFTSFSLNDIGQVAFRAVISGATGGDAQDSGVFIAQGDTFSEVIREGNAPPDGNGSFIDFNTIHNFGLPLISNDGHAAFFGELDGTTGGSDDAFGIFSGNGVDGLQKIVREGDAAPDGNGTFASFNFSGFNDVGKAAFRGNLRATSGGNSDAVGVYVGDGLSSPVQIARLGQTSPDSDGFLSSVTAPDINSLGQVAFRTEIVGTNGGVLDGRAILRGHSSNSLSFIARRGDAAPDGNGTFTSFLINSLNDSGSVTFNAGLTDTAGGNNDNRGIFRSNGTSESVQIVRKGELAPDGNGSFSDFFNLASNLGNETVFLGQLASTSGGFSDDQGVFRGDGFATPLQIARRGDAAPSSSGIFSFFFDLEVNEVGQVAFLSFLSGDSVGLNSGPGIFLYDDDRGLLKVAREGDNFLGSTIAGLSFVTGSDNPSSLNNHGQVAYRFELADGRLGIAIATVVPEPSAFLLSLLAACMLLQRRRD